MKFIKQLYANLLVLTYFFIFAIDVIAIKYPAFSVAGVTLWYLTYIYLLIYTFKCLKDLLGKMLSGKFLLTILTASVFVFTVLINIPNQRNLHNEATQEIACALEQFTSEEDKGFRKTCLFGYPTRQFLLPLIPSLLFGRTQFNLNLGMSLYFLIGLVIFANGITKFLENKKNNDLIGAITLSILFHIHWLNHFLFFYEQSMFPFSFGLSLVGLYLSFQKHRSTQVIILIGFVLSYLIYAYTPGLALVFLAVCTIAYLLLKNKLNNQQKPLFLGILTITLASVVLSLMFRTDLNFYDGSVGTKDIWTFIINSFKHLIFRTEGDPYVSEYLHLPFVIFLFFAPVFFYGKSVFFFTLWILGTIVIAVVARGYSYYGIDFRLHKSIVFFPVYLLILLIFLSTFKNKMLDKYERVRKYLLSLVLLFLLGTGILYQQNFLNNKEISKHITLNNWFAKTINRDDYNVIVHIFIDSNLNNDDMFYASLGDTMQYFNPNITTSVLSESCELDSEDFIESKKYIIYSQENYSGCFAEKIQINNSQRIVMPDGRELTLARVI